MAGHAPCCDLGCSPCTADQRLSSHHLRGAAPKAGRIQGEGAKVPLDRDPCTEPPAGFVRTGYEAYAGVSATQPPPSSPRTCRPREGDARLASFPLPLCPRCGTAVCDISSEYGEKTNGSEFAGPDIKRKKGDGQHEDCDEDDCRLDDAHQLRRADGGGSRSPATVPSPRDSGGSGRAVGVTGQWAGTTACAAAMKRAEDGSASVPWKK